MQTGWAQQLNPVISNPITQSVLLTDVPIRSGVNVINHTLGRMMQGWIVTDINGGAQIYRTKPLNSLTLTLTSDLAATISLLVF